MDRLSPEAIGAIVGILVTVGLRVLDSLLPKGYHFRFMDRLIVDDDVAADDTPEAESNPS